MKKPKAPKLVTVAVTTTITIIFWIFFTLYQVLTAKSAPSVDPNLLAPIDPTLDSESLDSIKTKVFFEQGGFTPLPTTTLPEVAPTDLEIADEVEISVTPVPETVE